MKVLLIADDGSTTLAVENAERYPLLDLAAHLRLAITAVSEGWELPDPLAAEPCGEPQILAAVQPDEPEP